MPSFNKPVNKVGADDWKKQQDCTNLIKKLNREKKERKQKLE